MFFDKKNGLGTLGVNQVLIFLFSWSVSQHAHYNIYNNHSFFGHPSTIQVLSPTILSKINHFFWANLKILEDVFKIPSLKIPYFSIVMMKKYYGVQKSSTKIKC